MDVRVLRIRMALYVDLFSLIWLALESDLSSLYLNQVCWFGCLSFVKVWLLIWVGIYFEIEWKLYTIYVCVEVVKL